MILTPRIIRGRESVPSLWWVNSGIIRKNNPTDHPWVHYTHGSSFGLFLRMILGVFRAQVFEDHPRDYRPGSSMKTSKPRMILWIIFRMIHGSIHFYGSSMDHPWNINFDRTVFLSPCWWSQMIQGWSMDNPLDYVTYCVNPKDDPWDEDDPWMIHGSKHFTLNQKMQKWKKSGGFFDPWLFVHLVHGRSKDDPWKRSPPDFFQRIIQGWSKIIRQGRGSLWMVLKWPRVKHNE